MGEEEKDKSWWEAELANLIVEGRKHPSPRIVVLGLCGCFREAWGSLAEQSH